MADIIVLDERRKAREPTRRDWIVIPCGKDEFEAQPDPMILMLAVLETWIVLGAKLAEAAREMTP